MILVRLESFPIKWVLLISGLMGFLLGAFANPTWQHAVEGAQVVAGLIDLKNPSPFLMYEAGLWTLSHQVLAASPWIKRTFSFLECKRPLRNAFLSGARTSCARFF
jgi:hypothetical protein